MDPAAERPGVAFEDCRVKPRPKPKARTPKLKAPAEAETETKGKLTLRRGTEAKEAPHSPPSDFYLSYHDAPHGTPPPRRRHVTSTAAALAEAQLLKETIFTDVLKPGKVLFRKSTQIKLFGLSSS